MRNQSQSEMLAELKASKSKMIFMAILVVFGTLGLVMAFVDGRLPGQAKEFTSASYSDMMVEIYSPGQTTAQREARKERYIGKWVRWSGSVVDVSQSGRSYVVSISATTSGVLTDIYLRGLSEAEALNLRRGARVSYTGKIERIEDGLITGYVHLSRIAFE